jgi:hypothetical protein
MFNERLQQLILKTHRMVFPFPRGWIDARGNAAGKLIRTRLQSKQPCLIARFGSIEIEAMMAYLHRNETMSPLQRFYKFASWDVRYTGWEEALKSKLVNNTGFFPADEERLDRFAELYLSIAPQIDIIGSWVHSEILLRDKMPTVKRIPLADLEPYMNEPPWSAALAGLKVLVVHPFTESIERQYAEKEHLFANPDVLPEFELLTLKAVQSAGGSSVPFKDWFEALESMKKKTEMIDFDIAIIGAGAYGMPLAAHVKELGKKAVHLGGATQMLFGIYGQRWINDPRRNHLINDHWVRPLDSEKAVNAQRIENGCYW